MKRVVLVLVFGVGFIMKDIDFINILVFIMDYVEWGIR